MPLNYSSFALVALLLFHGSACGSEAAREKSKKELDSDLQVPKESEQPIVVSRPQPLEPKTMRWGEYEFTHFGLTVPILGDVRLREGEMSGDMYIRQRRNPIQLSAWIGQLRTLENWRAGYNHRKGAHFSAPIAGPVVCGKPSILQELTIPGYKEYVGGPQPVSELASPALKERAAAAPEVSFGRRAGRAIPPQTVKAMSIKIHSTPALLTWAIDSAKREKFSIHEAHFFSSLECE